MVFIFIMIGEYPSCRGRISTIVAFLYSSIFSEILEGRVMATGFLGPGCRIKCIAVVLCKSAQHDSEIISTTSYVTTFSTSYHLTSFCLRADKWNDFIKRCLDYYTDRHFITSNNQILPMKLRLDILNESKIYCEMAKLLGYNSSALAPSMLIVNIELISYFHNRNINKN